MRYVTAIFDAPMPARLGLRLLREAGFQARDWTLLPPMPDASPTAPPPDDPPSSPPALDPTRDLAESLSELSALGLPRSTQALATEALGRGALVLVVHCPDLAAEAAAEALEAAGALPPELAARTWAAQPELRYRWSELPAPRLATLSATEAPAHEPVPPEPVDEASIEDAPGDSPAIDHPDAPGPPHPDAVDR